MLLTLLYATVMLGIGVGGAALMRFPDAFVIGANPLLQLLKKHLPDAVARRTIQELGAVLLFFSS
ncbi:MAG: hypothetical protein ABEK84_04545 [Salinibacter sp.]